MSQETEKTTERTEQTSERTEQTSERTEQTYERTEQTSERTEQTYERTEQSTESEDLSGLVTDFMNELPEDMRGLIPDSLSAVEKIKLARGLIAKVATIKTTQDGPGSETPGKKQAPDYSGMTSLEKIEAGLK